MIQLDTHVLLWLLADGRRRVPRQVAQRIDREDVAISPMVLLELTLLHEIGKVRQPPDELLNRASRMLEVALSRTRFPAVAREAAGFRWARDIFDRVICAQATVDRADLVSADGLILEHFPHAIWD